MGTLSAALKRICDAALQCSTGHNAAQINPETDERLRDFWADTREDHGRTKQLHRLGRRHERIRYLRVDNAHARDVEDRAIYSRAYERG